MEVKEEKKKKEKVKGKMEIEGEEEEKKKAEEEEEEKMVASRTTKENNCPIMARCDSPKRGFSLSSAAIIHIKDSSKSQKTVWTQCTHSSSPSQCVPHTHT